jgi:hypothetical protein
MFLANKLKEYFSFLFVKYIIFLFLFFMFKAFNTFPSENVFFFGITYKLFAFTIERIRRIDDNYHCFVWADYWYSFVWADYCFVRAENCYGFAYCSFCYFLLEEKCYYVIYTHLNDIALFKWIRNAAKITHFP